VLARAHDLGLVLVGDVDAELTGRLRRAAPTSPSVPGTAYGLLRLTFRRR
jgi:hypothetical protein